MVQRRLAFDGNLLVFQLEANPLSCLNGSAGRFWAIVSSFAYLHSFRCLLHYFDLLAVASFFKQLCLIAQIVDLSNRTQFLLHLDPGGRAMDVLYEEVALSMLSEHVPDVTPVMRFE